MDSTEIHSVAKRLMLVRGLRSIGQGAMVVDITLYLAALHWSGTMIGGVTSAAGLFGAILILFVGIISDKLGRKPFLLIFELLTMTAAVASCFTTKAIVLVLAIVVVGFGRGQSGAAGPFSPAEQAWLARCVKQSQRGKVFSINNAIGFIGMALGAAIGGLPGLMHVSSPLLAYRPIFILVAIFSLLCAVVLINTKETKDVSDSPAKSKIENEKITQTSETNILRQENIAMFKFALINTINGIAVGLTGPMMAYWFSLRYHVGTEAIGVTLSLSFLLTGIFSIINGFLAERYGMVKSVTWMRVIGSILMVALPFMPNFSLASFIYVIRNAINRGTQGSRSALSASLTRDKRRGLATSINALSMRLPSAIGPAISGYMFETGLLALPLVLTAGLQLINAGLYQWVFGNYDQTKNNS
ncbi:arabinose efflux permease family protein [Desulfosporosinus acidiphilus SJ4]|uniref:Arabinose efflux permease family protein n=1 Tax=Desulfosporosinus acidiphilus (strain DSM 22704 / JCM 16185 / SJ4) TaxID=646529 RepID=I4D5P6_DESAJ|nr:MFS transporter [Desulfosporosinus acidiphilus]AFM41120.1 arabinose efflux permease family protein [Desulfosporosinus acidiphilus SJ4]